jgi:hypothetical protein
MAFWLFQHSLKPTIRTWALLTLPATFLHELAHWIVGATLQANPTAMSLWPKKLGSRSWRLGYVSFTDLRWWNAGPVALAPMIWFVLIVALFKHLPALPAMLTIAQSLWLGQGLVWLWIAVAPGRSDWSLAWKNPISSIAFLSIWAITIFWLFAPVSHMLSLYTRSIHSPILSAVASAPLAHTTCIPMGSDGVEPWADSHAIGNCNVGNPQALNGKV